MDHPRIGIDLPTFGAHAGPGSIVEVARAVERLGFHSVTASERLLLPAGPDWRNDAGLPDAYVWDTIEALTWAAAHTRTVRLGMGVVNALFQPPIVLARRLATLDRLSGGRLDVGLGQGWLPEEFEAVGVPVSRRGAGFEEHLAAMRACWGPDPVRYEGKRYRVPLAKVGPKPVDGLPVWIGAVARPAVERAARIGDGFIAPVRDWDSARELVGWYRNAGGTGPVVLRSMPCRSEDVVQAALDDLEQAAALDAHEIHWSLGLTGLGIDEQISIMEEIAAGIGQ